MADEAAEGIAPTLLLAMPQLLDPNFHRSVVLLCKHNDEGALGFVVNRPVETTLTELLSLDPAGGRMQPLGLAGRAREPGARLAALPFGARGR